MKTVEERAKSTINFLRSIDRDTTTGNEFFEEIELQIKLRLKEQDKFTRHACAEAINNMKSELGWIKRDSIHQAIMNTKSI